MLAQGPELITRISAAKDALYIKTQQEGVAKIRRLPNGQNQWEDLCLPVEGEPAGLTTNPDLDGFLIHVYGWTQAPQWYSYDPQASFSNTQIEPQNPADMSGFTFKEVNATAPDGTQVPLSIIYKRGLILDGSHPCLIEGYGSYGLILLPNFDATRIALLERGGVIAYAHIRGGGEKGLAWHTAGSGLKKQNSITDFIACANYLISKGYTSSGRIAGKGTSAGGIVIGGALTQRPDLFSLAICNVGLMNPLRLEQSPNGPGNTPEFGSVRFQSGFLSLYGMDAYHHVKNGVAYPTVLLIRGLTILESTPGSCAK